MKTYVITGICGFIGTNLALRLLEDGNRVIGFDRISSRHSKNIEELSEYKNCKIYDIDLSVPYVDHIMLGMIGDVEIEMVFHLAANADVRFSSVYPNKDVDDGIITTYNILKFLKLIDVKRIAYSSSSAIYGIVDKIPTPENSYFTQTSFYGASKLSGEALIQAHCESYDAKCYIFRHASITGPRYSHGFIYNFYKKLKENPNELYIHGGKEQRKTYLDVSDCIEAMLTIVDKADERINIYNIGNLETCSLLDSIPVITNYLGVDPKLIWSGNEVGWIGDSKINDLDVTKLISLGWKPKYNIKQSIIRTLDWLENNQWILDIREEI